MAKKYRHLFIDFDDTLYDTHGNAEKVLRRLFEEFGLSEWFERPDTFYEAYWPNNVILWSEYAAGKIDKAYLMVERFRRPLSLGRNRAGEKLVPTTDYCQRLNDWFLDQNADMPGVVEGAHELMTYLRGRGYGLHMCSNGFHEVQYRKLRASGLLDFFDTVILSEDAGVNKPSADFFAYALRESGAKAEQTLMIGDNFVTDIQGARAAGIDAMFFNRYPDDFQAPERVEYEITKLEEAIGLL